LVVPLLAIALGAGGSTSAAGQSIQLVLDGALKIFESPNPDFEEFGLEGGDPVRFIVEFDAESLTDIVDLLLIRIDGTTFTNSSDFEYGTFYGLESSPDMGFGFSLFTVDTFRGVRNGIDLGLFSPSAVKLAFELKSDEFSTSAVFPVDLTFEDVSRLDSGFFELFAEPFRDDVSHNLTVDFTDLSVHVIPEPPAAALILSVLATLAAALREKGRSTGCYLIRRHSSRLSSSSY
jgi:hypothetical protein